MGERLVGVGHLVGILALLHSVAGTVHSVHDLVGQPLAHGALIAGAGVGGEPAQAQGFAALGPHFQGHLIGGAAHGGP